MKEATPLLRHYADTVDRTTLVEREQRISPRTPHGNFPVRPISI